MKTNIDPGFSLKSVMKSPVDGALSALDSFIAPPGSGRRTSLIRASDSCGVYEIEYRIYQETTSSSLRAISILADAEGSLYTLTVVAPEAEWSEDGGSKLRKIASSFRLKVMGN